MGVSDHRSRFIALGRIRRRRGSSMVMPSLKSGSGAARRRFWLAMSGFVMALALMPFSYKVERRLETAAHIKGGESEKVDKELAQRFQSPYAHRLETDRKSTRLNSSHGYISYAVFCLKKKKTTNNNHNA